MGPQLERFIKAVSRFVSLISEICEWWIDKQMKSYRMDIVSLIYCFHIPGSKSANTHRSMLCWSASFYPQPIDNFRRRSTTGLAIDYPTANILGFVCYTIYSTTFFFSPVIRRQYASRHLLSEDPTVRFNDVAFAVHALILCILTYTQFWPLIWGFTVSRHQKTSIAIKGILWGSVALVGIVTCVVLATSPDGGYNPHTWAWIDVVSQTGQYTPQRTTDPRTIPNQIYFISYIKLFLTVIKYIPQAWLNFKRKSTENWKIEMILLDFVGGILSLLQLFIDSSFNEDWSGVTGNPAKLVLSNVSIVFDLIFMVQHFILYRDSPGDLQNKRQYPNVVTPLLAESNADNDDSDDDSSNAYV